MPKSPISAGLAVPTPLIGPNNLNYSTGACVRKTASFAKNVLKMSIFRNKSFFHIFLFPIIYEKLEKVIASGLTHAPGLLNPNHCPT